MDPFIYLAHHYDHYPAGNARMEVPHKPDGSDFREEDDFEMYGNRGIPGFPQHPHRGFETVTATLTGTIDHSDSMGTAGRYGGGDLQWMTAGKGILHSEMFPLLHTDQPNPLHMFQIWLNLPAAQKMVEPGFVMHWREEIPKVRGPGSEVIVWAGQFGSAVGLPPPPASWAANKEAEVAVWHVRLEDGAQVTLPAATKSDLNRCLYFYAGEHALFAGQKVRAGNRIEVDSGAPLPVSNVSGGEKAVQFLVLQGRPIGEPVHHRGPFVMNSKAELDQALADYQMGKFAPEGWPWPKEATVFPRERERFALINGVESHPPSH